MKPLLFFLVPLFILTIKSEGQVYYFDTSLNYTKVKSLDSFINSIPDIGLREISSFLRDYKFHTSQLGLVVERDRVVSAYEPFFRKTKPAVSNSTSTTIPQWYLFCETNYGFANTEALKSIRDDYYTSKDKAFFLTFFLQNVSENYSNNFISTHSFESYKAVIDSLLTINSTDTAKALYCSTLGSIYLHDNAHSPENKAKAFYYFSRGRFYIENYKRSTDILNNTPPIFNEKEKQLKYPTYKLLLSQLYQGCTNSLTSFSDFDPPNSLRRLLNLRNYNLLLTEKLYSELLESGLITEHSFLFLQKMNMQHLSKKRYPAFSTQPDSVLENQCFLNLFYSRINNLPKKQSVDSILKFEAIYYLANCLYNKKQYTKALKLYIYALKYQAENWIPNSIDIYERETIVKMIVACCAKANIHRDELSIFYTAVIPFLKNFVTERPLDFYTYAITEYQLGFTELISIYFSIAKGEQNEAYSILQNHLKKCVHIFLSNKEANLESGPFMSNFIDCWQLLGQRGREEFYSKNIKNHTGDTRYLDMLTQLSSNNSLFNSSPDILEYNNLFQNATNQVNGELFLEQKTIIDEQNRKQKNISRILLLLGIVGIAFSFFLVFRWVIRKNKRDKTKIQELLKEEKKNLMLMYRNHIHNLNRDQTIFTNNLSQGNTEFSLDMNEKFVQYTRNVNNSIINEKITLSEALNSVTSYWEFLQKHYAGLFLEPYIDPAIDTEKVYFIPLVFETLLNNSLHHGFKEKNYSGTVYIKIERHEAFLYCRVHDNGIPAPKIEDYFTGEEHGIELIKSRVEYIYKKKELRQLSDSFSISFLPKKQGTSIRIKIPYNEKIAITHS